MAIWSQSCRGQPRNGLQFFVIFVNKKVKTFHLDDFQVRRSKDSDQNPLLQLIMIVDYDVKFIFLTFPSNPLEISGSQFQIRVFTNFILKSPVLDFRLVKYGRNPNTTFTFPVICFCFRCRRPLVESIRNCSSQNPQINLRLDCHTCHFRRECTSLKYRNPTLYFSVLNVVLIGIILLRCIFPQRNNIHRNDGEKYIVVLDIFSIYCHAYELCQRVFSWPLLPSC